MLPKDNRQPRLQPRQRHAGLPDNSYAFNFPITGYNQYQPAGSGYGPALLPNGQPAVFQTGIPAPVADTVPTNGILPGGQYAAI